MPAVRFQLGFAGTSRPDARTKAGQSGPLPREPGQQIFELGEFHLQFPLPALGPQGKDIKYEHGAVDHPDAAQLFQVPDLGGREFPVKNHQVQFFLSAQLSHFLGHAGTHTGCGIRRRPLLRQGKRRISPCAFDKFGKLRKRALRVIFSSIQTDKERTLLFFFRFVQSNPSVTLTSMRLTARTSFGENSLPRCSHIFGSS